MVNRISGGERQICIACSLAQQSQLVILDESTSALDYDNQIKDKNLAKMLSEIGYAILMTNP